MSTLFATSLVSQRTGAGRVDLHHNDHRFAQVSATEARAWALNILEVAEAADTDAFLMNFFTEEIKTDVDHAVRMLAVFRQWRDEKHAEAQAGETDG